jgi:epoxyqueuosine reductase QueG
MTVEINAETVKEYGLNAGASVVGITTTKDFGLAPAGFKPSDNLPDCLSVVVLGTPFPQEALLKNSAEYTEIRNEMLKRMDSIAKEVAKQITRKGHKAKAIGGIGGKYVNGKFFGQISLKHAAELAGLGVIGRNYLLTNPEYGNLLWFSAVLTDAELVPDKKAEYTVCDNCNKCVETCPSKALDNPVEFGKKECNATCWKMVDRKWELKCCLCRKVCPYRFGKIDQKENNETI